eukprot:m.244738 g.244738  ORF g.244738 m.244738 type:complete len:88 (+) comp40247_c1_seq65:64-327(+)
MVATVCCAMSGFKISVQSVLALTTLFGLVSEGQTSHVCSSTAQSLQESCGQELRLDASSLNLTLDEPFANQVVINLLLACNCHLAIR